MKELAYKHSHSITALLITLAAALAGLCSYAVIAIVAFYFAREHAQAEQRCIKEYYGNKRANAPWYVGFEPRAWNKDSLINDAVLPTAVSILVNLLIG